MQATSLLSLTCIPPVTYYTANSSTNPQNPSHHKRSQHNRPTTAKPANLPPNSSQPHPISHHNTTHDINPAFPPPHETDPAHFPSLQLISAALRFLHKPLRNSPNVAYASVICQARRTRNTRDPTRRESPCNRIPFPACASGNAVQDFFLFETLGLGRWASCLGIFILDTVVNHCTPELSIDSA